MEKPNDFLIRTGSFGDVEAIVSLSAALFREDGGQRDPGINVHWPEEHGEAYFRSILEEDSHLTLLVEVDGQVVGYLHGYLKEKSPLRTGQTAELGTMYVREAYRSRGLGSELARQFLAWAKERSARHAMVSAYVTNERAIAFYKKLGFTSLNLNLMIDLKCVDLYFQLDEDGRSG